jgi:hypothetical protein
MRLEAETLRKVRGHRVGDEYIEYHNRFIHLQRRRSG